MSEVNRVRENLEAHAEARAMKPTRWERLMDRTPTWLIALIIFAPGWVYVICVLAGGF